MSVQHERLIDLCNELRLGGVAAQYSALAQNAAEKRTSFTDFLEELLVAERESRRARAREMFARVAGFPAIKTLDQYDFGFATGAPRKQIMELASLAFVERAENVVFLGPSGVGKTHLAIALGLRIFKTRWFTRFARGERNTDSSLSKRSHGQGRGSPCLQRGNILCQDLPLLNANYWPWPASRPFLQMARNVAGRCPSMRCKLCMRRMKLWRNQGSSGAATFGASKK